MTLAESLDVLVRLRVALAIGLFVSLVVLVVTPRAIRMLRGAGIVGRGLHKPGWSGSDGEPLVLDDAADLSIVVGVSSIIRVGTLPASRSAGGWPRIGIGRVSC
jgi:hypothetical protein